MRISKLSIVVPVFNEIETLPVMYEKLKSLRLGGREKQVIFVDDGSTDGSTEWLRWVKMRDKDSAMKFVFCGSNGGKGKAVKRALEVVEGEYVIVQDADLEYDPSEIIKLVRSAEKNNFLAVYGNRNGEIRNRYLYPHYYWGSKLLAAMLWLLFGLKISDPETCYKLIHADLLRFIGLEDEGFGVEMEVSGKICQLGLPIGEVAISYKPRSFAEGKKIRAKDGIVAMGILARIFLKDLHYGVIDRWLRMEREKRVDRHVIFSRKEVVLDVGCGRQAHLGWKIMNRVSRYVGVDLEVPEVEIANMRLVRGDVEKIGDLGFGAADKIIGLAILEYLKDPGKFVKECRKILAKGGELILTTPHPRSDVILKMAAGMGLIEKKEILDHKVYFDRGKLRDLLLESKYEILVEEGFWGGLNTFVRAKAV